MAITTGAMNAQKKTLRHYQLEKIRFPTSENWFISSVLREHLTVVSETQWRENYLVVSGIWPP